eukprot:TRINITY_DN56189_c0_g1_i1.p1 TRINITY_DN56189_c0_g1~~TRINITY_DN56189_c0_g1_i1.p1  ORF type:complete len:788 (+),score=183.92 TRINITY_DN56189_c0_g1_i1:335-2365(+)
MSSPKETFTHLSLILGDVEASRENAEQYGLLYNVLDDGRLGPVIFDGEELSISPCGALSALFRTLMSYASASQGRLPREICVSVPDAFVGSELHVVRAALSVAGFDTASVLRHSDAVAVAFLQGSSAELLSESTPQRIVAFIDIGNSHGTFSVVRYAGREASTGDNDSKEGSADVVAEFIFRRSERRLGVQTFVAALADEAKSRIEAKHKCTVNMRSKAGQRLRAEAVHTLKHLSMLPDAELRLESLLPEGPEGPEFDVSLSFNRAALEAAAAPLLERLREIMKEGFEAVPEGASVEGVEVVGGGGRIPAVQALIKEIAGDAVPLRFGLDGASCVATGAAAWAAGRRAVPAWELPTDSKTPSCLNEEALAGITALEDKIEGVNRKEVERLDKRNALESRVYQVKDWLSGKDGDLLKPDVTGPYLDKVTLWFEDAEMQEKPATLEDYSQKLSEVDEFVNREGAGFFEKKAKEREEQEKALEKAAEDERQRRKELGMDADKDDRHMKKEDRLRLAAKNKDEGNDMFKAQKYDDALRRYKKAVDHVSRPEAASNMTPEEAEEARKIKVSCHLNSAQCYLKAADTAHASGGKNAAEPFYKKARVSCEDVLDLDAENIKALFRRSLCWEKLGEQSNAMKDIKKALVAAPDDADLKRSQARIEKLMQKEKEGQKKVFSKMFG